MTLEQYNEVRKTEEKMLNLIHKNNPGFFNDFKSKLTSNNHIAIEESIMDGTNALEDAIESDPNLYKQFLLGKSFSEDINMKEFIENGEFNAEKFSKYVRDNHPDNIVSPTVVVAAVAIYLAVAISVVVVVNVAVGGFLYAGIIVYAEESIDGNTKDRLKLNMIVDNISKISWVH